MNRLLAFILNPSTSHSLSESKEFIVKQQHSLELARYVRHALLLSAGALSVNAISAEAPQAQMYAVSDVKNATVHAKTASNAATSKPASLYASESVTPKPRLSVQGPKELLMQDGQLTPATFNAFSNYTSFIKNWTLRVYREDDTAKRTPIFEKTVNNMMSAPLVWDGKVSSGKPLEGGDRVFYEVEVTGKSGGKDVTKLQGVLVNSNAQVDIKKQVDEIVLDPISAHPYLELSRRDDTLKRGIIVNGSMLTVKGTGFKPYMPLEVAGLPVTANEQGQVHVEFHQGVGKYALPVKVNGQSKTLMGAIAKQYFFLAGLADITAGKGKVTSASKEWVEAISANDQFDKDIYVDGRLAFYLKGKVQGKYLITAQMDTREGKLSDIVKNLDKRTDTDSLLERIDPNRYYPVYGDQSTIERDVDTQGKFYVRMNWDHSSVLWGNFNTNMTGTQLGEYNRTLYGAQADYRSVEKTKFNDHKVQASAFASKPSSAAARDEFEATGGSLFYLKHQDVVAGSEKIWIEVRDPQTKRVLERKQLVQGLDYDLNDAQGLVTLTRALSSYVSDDTLTNNTILDGNSAYVISAYEYEAGSFSNAENLNTGGRAKVWLSDHVGVGATVVQEENNINGDYKKKALDATLKLSEGTHVSVEFAKSENAEVADFNSSYNGGLTQSANTNTVTQGSGSAVRIDARLDLQDVSNVKGSVGAWSHRQDAGFDSFNRTGEDYEQIGVESQVAVTDDATVSGRYVKDKATNTTERAHIRGDYRTSDKVTVSGEYARETSGANDRKDLIAAQVSTQVNDATRVYAKAQTSLNEKGTYVANKGADVYTLGVENRVSSKFRVHAEASDGDLGTGAQVGASYSPVSGHDFYVNADVLDSDNGNRKHGITVGQRSQVNNKLSVYQEYQHDRSDSANGDEASMDKVWGARYQVNDGWSVGGSYEVSDVNNTSANDIERKAGSLHTNYKDKTTQFSARAEVRVDKGADKETQYLYAGRYRRVLNDETTMVTRLDVSESKKNNKRSARFTDAQVGLAHRPRANDKLNVLGLYRYVYDLAPEAQEDTSTDQEAHVVSVDAVYEVNDRLELGGKIAHKEASIRTDRDQGTWTESGASLAAVRARYHVLKKADVLAEYRIREVPNVDQKGNDQRVDGALVEAGYHVNEHLRASVGYNFSTFSDDVADEDYDREGVFVNLVGKY